MSHVSKVRKIFENQDNLQSLPDFPSIKIRNHNNQDPFHTSRFKRSQTLIDFSKFNNNRNISGDDDESSNGETDKRDHVEEKNQNSVERKFLNESHSHRFERQNSDNSETSYRSIRRSPAFRRADAEKKKPVTPPKSIKLTRQNPITPVKIDHQTVEKTLKPQIDELEYLATSDTIKKALKSPLPQGPAPKKPPRVFAIASPVNLSHRTINLEDLEVEQESPKVVQSLMHKNVKLELEKQLIKPKIIIPKKKKVEQEKKGIATLLQCIITPCSIDPIYKETIRREQAQKQRVFCEEEIYTEPFAHLDKDFDNNFNTKMAESSSSPSSSSTTKTEELHYMCTNILDQTNNNFHHESSEDSRRSSFDYSYSSDVDMVNESFDKVHTECDNILTFLCVIWICD